MFKCGGKSRPKDALSVSGNAIVYAGLVLDRKRPGRKGPIRSFRPGSFDFSLERIDPRQWICGLGKPAKIEAGCGRLIMNASDKCRDRIPFRARDVTKIGRFKQRDIALLSILP